jgi:predicted DCC family thiol-disulfide oxidoreductase YuxK
MVNDGPVILFDGVCSLCNSAVRFIYSRDPNANLRFANLQSEFGQHLLRKFNRQSDNLDTLILIEGDDIHTYSTGSLRIARYLRFPWSLFRVLLILPRFLRDAVYKLVARNRYLWFGLLKACPLPTPELESRFIS